MARERRSRTRFRLGLLGGLIGGMVTSVVVATTAFAAISGFNPSSGAMTPGGSAQTNFTVNTPILSCITATVPLGFSVSMTGLGVGLGPLQANCVLGGGQVGMTVTASQNATPGNYTVTITEVEARLIGGDLINTYEWPFTVTAPPTTTSSSTSSTTSTTSTSTTSTSSTTSSTSTTVTTTPTTATPSTAPAYSGATPSTTAPPTTTTRPTSTTETTTSLPSESTLPDETNETDDSDDSDPVATPSPGAIFPGEGSGSGMAIVAESESSSLVSISDRLRDRLVGALPLTVAEAVLSPLVIAEFLFRSVLSSALGYLIPLIAAGIVGGWMVWRMRREVTGDELAI